jgi:nitrate reductase cytochrome c-type subunit
MSDAVTAEMYPKRLNCLQSQITTAITTTAVQNAFDLALHGNEAVYQP